jgi:[ribosomal protein S18]-alanine N-acetyltransferase
MQDPSWSIARLGAGDLGGDDLDRVAALEAAAFSNPWTRDMLARELGQSTATRMYVLRVPDEGVVAFCACWLVLDEAHINTLTVEQSRRRRGIATALLEHVLADLAAAGATRATLEVRRSNAAAFRLYARLGFVVAAIRPMYYSRPEEDGLILWRYDLQQVRAAPPHP